LAALFLAVALRDGCPSATGTGSAGGLRAGLRRAVSGCGASHDGAAASKRAGPWIVESRPPERDSGGSGWRRRPIHRDFSAELCCGAEWPALSGLGARVAQPGRAHKSVQHMDRPELQPGRRLPMRLRGGSAAGDGSVDGAAGAMEMTETLEPSAERDRGVVGAGAAAGVGDGSGASVEDLNVGSSGMSAPLSPAAPGTAGRNGGKGSSYMGSSAGTGSGDVGDGGSGGSGAGGMGSSSTVKTYRHPTNSKKRNMIRDKFATALTPFYRELEDKYTPLKAAVAIEHSMYRYFGKV